MKNISLNGVVYIFALGLMTSVLSGCDQFGGNAPKIAYVDVAKVLSDSSIGKQEIQRNQDVKTVLLKAEGHAKEKYKTMPDKQQQQSRDADNITLNQLWIAEQQHSRDMSVKAIAEEAESYRASHHLDYVIVSASVLAAKNDANITNELIKQLEKKKVNYGDLPKISVSEHSSEADKLGSVTSDDKKDATVSH